jgi:hypothetical protein
VAECVEADDHARFGQGGVVLLREAGGRGGVTSVLHDRWACRALIGGLAIAVGVVAVEPRIKLRSLVNHDFALTVRTRAEFRASWNLLIRSRHPALMRFVRSSYRVEFVGRSGT